VPFFCAMRSSRLLQLAAKVDRKTQARFFTVRFPSLRFGEVIKWLHSLGPRYCAVSPRSARRAEIKRIFALASRPAPLFSRNVWHHKRRSSAIQSDRYPTLVLFALRRIEYRHRT
jgi:hypothetical protein